MTVQNVGPSAFGEARIDGAPRQTSLVYGSVCSGIEAASVAWAPLGWSASFVSEIEAFPRAVLQHRWPEIPLHGDFTTIRAGEYRPIDLLVGGTPCQSFSVAGLRGGLDDERGNLALEYLRLADRLRPRWLVWENVPGVLSSAGGRDFGAILGGMVELGYGLAYRVLDAQFFGVAQRRRRVFVVGHLGDWRRAAAVLFERHGLQGHPAPRREAGESAPTLPSRSSGGGGLGTDFDCDGGLIASLDLENLGAGGNVGWHPADAPSITLNTNGNIGCAQVVGALQGGGSPKGHGTAGVDAQAVAAGHIVPVAFSSKDHGADAEYDLAPTLRAGAHSASHANAGVPPAVAFALRGREGGALPELGGDGVSALRAASGGSSRDYVAFDLAQITSAANRTNAAPGLPASTMNAKGQMHVAGTVRSHTRPGSNEVGSIVATSAVRRLTPRECERLQGFPDDYTAVPYRRKPAADGPRYKALGNSMAVPVMAWIGRRIQAVESLSVPAHGALLRQDAASQPLRMTTNEAA